MKSIIAVISIFCIINCYAWVYKPRVYGTQRCVNMWDEGCINGQLPGSGDDDDYLNGGFNPGKRCIMRDGGVSVVHREVLIPFADGDEDFLNGGFNPAKISLYERLENMRKSQKHQLA